LREPKSGQELFTSNRTEWRSGYSMRRKTMAVSGIISAIVVGLIIGALARLVLPGRQAVPIWLTILVGFVGAIIGTFLAKALGVDTSTKGLDFLEIVCQVVVAAAGIALVSGGFRGRSRRSVL
jgi:uncharacterized membrane protein YeaQ/YmgE (transglycosylase-associated protein family)